MPGLDGTGPMGQGTGTGRGLGNCKPANDTKDNTNISRPMGGAFGRGFGRGMGRGFSNGFAGRGFRRSKFTNNNNNQEGK